MYTLINILASKLFLVVLINYILHIIINKTKLTKILKKSG